ncbi:hypothetical protein J4E80_010683 [Alternaria sp. BMP 0032]|nr:hypothetical protein J4E80_010683 [Alternaria sp. BMP 0032]
MPRASDWDPSYSTDDEWSRHKVTKDTLNIHTRHVHPPAPRPPPRRVQDDEVYRPDYGRRTTEFLAPEVHYTTGLHRTRSQGHAPAPNVTIYNTSHLDNDSHPRVSTEQKGQDASPRGRRMPGGFEDLEDNIAALRADIKREHRSRSRHEYEHQRAPEPNYEDKIKLTLAEQRLRDLEDRLERERQERYHHHSPDRSYEDKVKLTLAEQRLRDAEQQLERERRHHSSDGYKDKIQEALTQQRLEEAEEKAERERWERETERREELARRRVELEFIHDRRDRETEAENIKRMEESMRRDWELKREREDRDRERRDIDEERKKAQIIAENRAKMSREQREAEEQRDKMLAKLEREQREQDDERKRILAEAKLKQAREQREAEEQREKILSDMEKKKKRENEERARIIAENTAKLEKEARERELKEKAFEEERKRIIADNEAKVAKQAREAKEAQQRAVDEYQRKKAKEEAEAQAEKDRIIYEYERKKILDADKEKRAKEELIMKLKLEEEERKRKEKEEFEAFTRKQQAAEEAEKRKKEAQEKELEETMRKRLAQFGFQDNQIQALVNPDKQRELQAGMMPNHPLHPIAPPAPPPPPHHHHSHSHSHSSSHQIAIAPPPTYAKVHRSHLDVETLHYYDIPYEFDVNPEYIIVLREMSQRETDILFEHTRRLRTGHGSKLFIESEGRDRHGKKEYAFVRKKSRSRSRSVVAFQAGGRPLPTQNFQPFDPRFAQPPPQFAQAPQAPDWAADFQRLNVSSPPPQTFQQQRQQPASAASAWHQDFLRQQAPVAQAPALQQTSYGGMSGYNMGGFGGQAYMQTPTFQNAQVSEVAQGKQRAQDDIPAFDEAAFEQAFAQAQQDMMETAEAEQVHTQPAQEALDLDRPGEMDPLLQRIRETRPAVYSAIQVWSETGLGRTDEAVAYLENMDRLEKSGTLVQDANEGKWIVDSLQRIVNRDAPQEVKTRAEELIKAINQRLMSQYPLGSRVQMSEEQIWQDLEAAGYMRTPEPLQHFEQKPEEEQKQEQPPRNEDDEMAATAGRLLERVADNTSEKFQNSQFLGLMRRLRDREVRVQEDKIVEVDASAQQPQQPTNTMTTPQTTISQQPSQQHPPSSTQIPEIDPTILSHAATDFETPIYYGDDAQPQQYAQPSPPSSPHNPPRESLITDEISEQYRYYNVHAAYHR